MDPEEKQRLEELEEQASNEELDEEERAELKELRAMTRKEKHDAKALAKFDKARFVFRVADPEENFYALDLATAQKWAGDNPIEQVERKALPGEFTVQIIKGFYGDGDDYGSDEVYCAK